MRSAHSGIAGSVRSTPGAIQVTSFIEPNSGWRRRASVSDVSPVEEEGALGCFFFDELGM
jgi:hypothetical protein